MYSDNEFREERSLLHILGAGDTCAFVGAYGIEYEFLKNQFYDEKDQSTNTVQICARHNGKVLCSLDMEKPVSDFTYEDMARILSGREDMVGIYHGISCPVEELRTKDSSLLKTDPNVLFKEYFLQNASLDIYPFYPKGKEGKEGKWKLEGNDWWLIGTDNEEYNSAFDIFDDLCWLDDVVIKDICDELKESKLSSYIDDDLYYDEGFVPAYLDFFNKYDNYEGYSRNRECWKFIQEHRWEFELCEMYDNKCKGVDLDKIYETQERENGTFSIPLMTDIEYTYEEGDYCVRVPLGYNEYLDGIIEDAKKGSTSVLFAKTDNQQADVFAVADNEGKWSLQICVPDGLGTVTVDRKLMDAEQSLKIRQAMLERYGKGFGDVSFTNEQQAKTIIDTMSSAQDRCLEEDTVERYFKDLNGYDITVKYIEDTQSFDISAQSEYEGVSLCDLDFDEFSSVINKMSVQEPRYKENNKKKTDVER